MDQEELARKRQWAKAKGLEEVDRVSPKPGNFACVAPMLNIHHTVTFDLKEKDRVQLRPFPCWKSVIAEEPSHIYHCADPQVTGLLRAHRPPEKKSDT